MSTKAQVWTADFVLSLLVVVIMLVVFGRTMVNITSSSSEEMLPLVKEGRAVSDLLVSEGYPVDWNSSTVVKIGLESDGRINSSKLAYFYSMNYSDVRKFFNTPYDFFVFLQDSDDKLINVSGSYGFGNPLVNASANSVVLSGVDSDRLIKINRIVIHDSKVVKLVVYLWD